MFFTIIATVGQQQRSNNLCRINKATKAHDCGEYFVQLAQLEKALAHYYTHTFLKVFHRPLNPPMLLGSQ
jgi:hypothetical protein